MAPRDPETMAYREVWLMGRLPRSLLKWVECAAAKGEALQMEALIRISKDSNAV